MGSERQMFGLHRYHPDYTQYHLVLKLNRANDDEYSCGRISHLKIKWQVRIKDFKAFSIHIQVLKNIPTCILHMHIYLHTYLRTHLHEWNMKKYVEEYTYMYSCTGPVISQFLAYTLSTWDNTDTCSWKIPLSKMIVSFCVPVSMTI